MVETSVLAWPLPIPCSTHASGSRLAHCTRRWGMRLIVGARCLRKRIRCDYMRLRCVQLLRRVQLLRCAQLLRCFVWNAGRVSALAVCGSRCRYVTCTATGSFSVSAVARSRDPLVCAYLRMENKPMLKKLIFVCVFAIAGMVMTSDANARHGHAFAHGHHVGHGHHSHHGVRHSYYRAPRVVYRRYRTVRVYRRVYRPSYVHHHDYDASYRSYDGGHYGYPTYGHHDSGYEW